MMIEKEYKLPFHTPPEHAKLASLPVAKKLCAVFVPLALILPEAVMWNPGPSPRVRDDPVICVVLNLLPTITRS